MNKKTELVYAIKALFDACNPRDIDPEEIPQRLETMNNLKELDFDDLLQALRFNAETVYAYSAEGCDAVPAALTTGRNFSRAVLRASIPSA